MYCFYKTCPCFFRRSDTQVSLANYASDDEGNVEFENLLAQRDPEPIAAYLDRTASSGNNAQGYLRVNPMSPFGRNGASSSRVSFASDDEDHTQDDAVSLPDEQISKFTEQLIDEQFKNNQQADAQLAAEEEEARLMEEAEIERKRQAAHKKAIARGFLPPIESTRTKDTVFSLEDDDSDEEQFTSATLGGSRTMELSTYTSIPPSPKRRYSRRTRSYRYDPSATEDEIDHPFAHILPDISGRIGAFLFGKRNEEEDEREDIYETDGSGQVNIDIEPSVDRQFAKDVDATELGRTEEHNSSLEVPGSGNDKSRSRSSSFRRFVEGVTSVFDTDVDI
ncbi:2811_t:CDS:2 [Paraglomus occultum]|uniref:2811_t:CDS:1 n=1 Tax=Paraglomus occultum TaxID=144539 RepID=A0A9N9AW15_9GLOM|nr:2811_t:CDS:2 [Paraglomus occultum]